MRDEWSSRIEDLAELQTQIRDNDADHLVPVTSTGPGAAAEAIARVERRLGLSLDPEYRAFLSHCDGWPGLLMDTDLFGCADLTGGDRMVTAQERVGWLEEEVAPGGELLPIAVSGHIDLFVTFVKDEMQVPPIVWMAGGEIERYDSFVEFFDAMVELNEHVLKALRGQVPRISPTPHELARSRGPTSLLRRIGNRTGLW